MSSYHYLFKYILVGSSGSGKSSLMDRFVNNSFNDIHDMTIGVEFGSRLVILDPPDGKRVKIQMWDSAGQETFRSITRSYYRGSAICMVVYDITDRLSFDAVSSWVEEVKNATGGTKPVICIVANMCDLAARRNVTTAEGKNLAAYHNAIFFETSAKTGEGVLEAFTDPARLLLSLIESGDAVVSTDHGIRRGHFDDLARARIDIAAEDEDEDNGRFGNCCTS